MFLSRVKLKADIAGTQLGSVLAERTYGFHKLIWDLFDQDKRDFLYREELAGEQLDDSVSRGQPVYYLMSSQAPKQDNPLFNVECKAYDPDIQVGQRFAFRLRANPVVTRDGMRHDLIMDEMLYVLRDVSQRLNLSIAGKKKDLLDRIHSAESTDDIFDVITDIATEKELTVSVEPRYGVRKNLDALIDASTEKRLMNWLSDNPSRTGIFSITQRTVDDEETDGVYLKSNFVWQGYRNHPIPEKRDRARFTSVDMSGELEVKDPERFKELLKAGIGPAKGFGCGLMLIRPAFV